MAFIRMTMHQCLMHRTVKREGERLRTIEVGTTKKLEESAELPDLISSPMG